MACGAHGGKMQINPQFKCDGPGCDHVKKECNHWFVIFLARHKSGKGIFVRFESWHRIPATDPEYKHACGEACLLKIISEHIKNHAQ
jgi:hypothetical protein